MSFKDLPKDIVWLIFRVVINGHISNVMFHKTFCYESGFNVETTLGGRIGWLTGNLALISKENLTCVGNQTCNLALISKNCLRLVQSKCYRYHSSWLFIKGALT